MSEKDWSRRWDEYQDDHADSCASKREMILGFVRDAVAEAVREKKREIAELRDKLAAERCAYDGEREKVAIIHRNNERLRGALDRLQDHHCSGLCDSVEEENHMRVMEQVNRALAEEEKP